MIERSAHNRKDEGSSPSQASTFFLKFYVKEKVFVCNFGLTEARNRAISHVTCVVSCISKVLYFFAEENWLQWSVLPLDISIVHLG